MPKEETSYAMPQNLHVLAVLTKFDTFISNYFAKRGKLLNRENFHLWWRIEFPYINWTFQDYFLTFVMYSDYVANLGGYATRPFAELQNKFPFVYFPIII